MAATAAAQSRTLLSCSTMSFTGSRISPGVSVTPRPAGCRAIPVPCAIEMALCTPRATANAIRARCIRRLL